MTHPFIIIKVLIMLTPVIIRRPWVTPRQHYSNNIYIALQVH